MNDATRYEKEFDLIFQQLEEKEQLKRQAAREERAAFVVRLLSFKAMQDLLANVSLADRAKIINECLDNKFPASE